MSNLTECETARQSDLPVQNDGERRSNETAAYVIRRDGGLPALSWLFRYGVDGAVLTCGRGVEAWSDGFFEGAWAGDLSQHDFHRVPDVFGSGARRTDDGWMLVPPSHVLEPIYLLKASNGWWLASNSLAFLLSAADAHLHFRWPRTLIGFMQIMNGIAHSPYRASTSQGDLSLLYHHNALLGSELQIRPKPSSPSFASFQDYRKYLADIMAATAANAAHSARRNCYRLLTTVSSGYDSSACAAVARTAGCGEGLTFQQSREGETDDGSKTGAHIGLKMIALQHALFSETDNHDTTVASEFFATGMQGEDIIFATAREWLRERLLVTGFHGDTIWGLSGKLNPTLKKMDLAGTGLGEFRLRENFIHLPLPYVGALRHADVQAISISPEMRPFMIGGDYDRPIPRRIVEEAGVPRGLFGQSKEAISMLVFSNRHMLPQGVRRPVEALIQAEPLLARLHYELASAWYKIGMSPYRHQPPGVRLLPPILAQMYRWMWSKMAKIVWPNRFEIFEHLDPISTYVMIWALSVVADRYLCVIDEQHDRQANASIGP
jgi:hypothetical protein